MSHPLDPPRHRTLKARYVFPVTAPPILDGVVTIRGQRIESVGPWQPGMHVEDLGNVAILPGLINAHTHLEFSHLDRPLGEPGIGLVDWIRLVIATRRQGVSIGANRSCPLPFGERSGVRGSDAALGAVLPAALGAGLPTSSKPLTEGLPPAPASATPGPGRAMSLGLAESTRSGVTALAEIAQPGWSLPALASAPVDATVFLELIAPTAERVEPAMQLALTHLAMGTPLSPCDREPNTSPLSPCGREANMSPLSPCGRGVGGEGFGVSSEPPSLGLSPHAPYTVHPELLRRVAALSARQNVPLAFHLAESREEIELLGSGTGPLRQFLEDMGAWDANALARGSRPLDYLRHLSAASRTLVIHGNYLADDEIEYLARHRDRMAVVYCPRTHAWFGHADYPLARMLEAGVNVALGTDSRASSPDLSILAEAREASKRHPGIDRRVILELATIRAAQALGRGSQIGGLQPGKLADLAVVALAEPDRGDPYDSLFGALNAATTRTIFRGGVS